MKTFLRMALPLALLIAAPLQAQTTLGVKGGISLSQTDIEDADFGSRTGFLGGAFARFGLGSSLALQPELLYVQKGATESDATLKLDYFEIPVLLQYRFATPGSLTPVLYAGPYVAVETKCELSGSDGGATVSFACDSLEPLLGTDIDTKSLDFGAIVGGGLDFHLGSVIVGAEARYEFGFVDVNDTSDVSVTNGGWAILGSVGFPLM